MSLISRRALAWTTAAIFQLLFASAVHAQATRTWVSGVGDDVNPCSRTAPCKTFAGAISKTIAGGEINVLDSCGCGAVTITKSITINGDGVMAGVLASSTNGVVVNVTSSDVVILRNLSINGAPPTSAGLNGVRMVGGGDLHIDNVRIYGFSQWGVDVQVTSNARVFVNDSTFRDNGAGAIFLRPTSPATVTSAVTRTQMMGNGRGLSAFDGTTVSIEGSTITGSQINGVVSYGQFRWTDVAIKNTTISNNLAYGVMSNTFSRVRIANSLVTGNDTGLMTQSGGAITSYGNNQVYGNITADGAPTATVGSM